jgi:hypothetical protein
VDRYARVVAKSKARDEAVGNGTNDLRRHCSVLLLAADNARLVVLVADIVIWGM